MFYLDRTGAAPLLKSTLLPFPHGFSTREGGVSVLPHTASLNLGFNHGDDGETVRKNLRIFAESIAGETVPVCVMSQIHSRTISFAVPPDENIGYYSDCDGLATDRPGFVLTARSADCGTLLLAYSEGSRRVVSAVHAGWRGTVAGIATAAVDAMTALGAEPKKIKAALGPCIGRCCFEIGGEVADEFKAAGFGDLVYPSERTAGKFYADIAAVNRRILLESGILPENVDAAPQCTKCEPDRFYSHRASGGVRGTLGAGIIIS